MKSRIIRYKWAVIMVSVVLIAIIIMIPKLLFFDRYNETVEETKLLIEIIISQEKDEWKNHLHAINYSRDIESVSATRKKLKDANVVLEGEAEQIDTISYETSTERHTTIKESKTEYTAKAVVGGKEYIVEVLFVSDSYGNGVKTFAMYPVEVVEPN